MLVADWDPFEGGAVAEAVVKGGGGDAAEEQEVVVAEFGFGVFIETHSVDSERDFGFGVFDLFEGVLGLTFVVDVEGHEFLCGGGEGGEVGRERDAGEFALEVRFQYETIKVETYLKVLDRSRWYL